MDDLAHRIKLAREAKGLTQKQIADHFGIKRVSVTQWESGETKPAIDKIGELSRLLNVTEDWLLSNRGEPPAKRRPNLSKLDELLEGFPRLRAEDQDFLLDMMRRLSTQTSSGSQDPFPPSKDTEKS